MPPGRLRLLLLLLVLAPAPALHALLAQPRATITVTAEPRQVTVGDRITVTVVITAPANATVDMAPLERQFDELDLLLVGLPQERALPDGTKEVRVRHEVAAFRPGDLRVPALTLIVTGPDGDVALTSEAIPIAVLSVLPPGADAAEVRDLKPQIDLDYRAGLTRDTALVAGGATLAVLVTAAVATWWLRRRARPTVASAPAPAASTPEATARAELERIAGMGLLDQGDLRAFHALLSVCVRRYLQERFGFPAVAMTTAELRARMERHGVGRWQARLAAGLLSECDAVTYARYEPARARAESNLDMAHEIVSLAEPQLEPAPVAVSG